MKILNFLGQELDPSKEHEIKIKIDLNEHPYGVTAIVKLNKKLFTEQIDGDLVELNNLTEIHNLYPTPVGKRIAFESDIHGTGFTYDVEDIISVHIVHANHKTRNI